MLRPRERGQSYADPIRSISRRRKRPLKLNVPGAVARHWAQSTQTWHSIAEIRRREAVIDNGQGLGCEISSASHCINSSGLITNCLVLPNQACSAKARFISTGSQSSCCTDAGVDLEASEFCGTQLCAPPLAPHESSLALKHAATVIAPPENSHWHIPSRHATVAGMPRVQTCTSRNHEALGAYVGDCTRVPAMPCRMAALGDSKRSRSWAPRASRAISKAAPRAAHMRRVFDCLMCGRARLVVSAGVNAW